MRDEVVPPRISIDRTFYDILHQMLDILLAPSWRRIDFHLQYHVAEYVDDKQMTTLRSVEEVLPDDHCGSCLDISHASMEVHFYAILGPLRVPLTRSINSSFSIVIWRDVLSSSALNLGTNVSFIVGSRTIDKISHRSSLHSDKPVTHHTNRRPLDELMANNVFNPGWCIIDERF